MAMQHGPNETKKTLKKHYENETNQVEELQVKRKSHEYEQNHKNDQEQKSQTQIGTTSEN